MGSSPRESSISAITGTAPTATTAAAVAIKVYPGPIPPPVKAQIIALVPELTIKLCFTPSNSAVSCSTLKDVGFDGFMIPDHVPHIIDDTEWEHRGRAYTIGYMTAFLELLNLVA